MQLSLLRRTSDRQHKNAKTCTKTDLPNWFALELPVWWQDIGNVVKSRSSSYCFVSKFLSHYSAVCWFSRYFFSRFLVYLAGRSHKDSFLFISVSRPSHGNLIFLYRLLLKMMHFLLLDHFRKWIFWCFPLLCLNWSATQEIVFLFVLSPNGMSSKSLLLTLLISKKEVRKYQKWWTLAKNRKEKWWNW